VRYRSVSPFVFEDLYRYAYPKWEGLTVLIDTYFWKKTEYPLWPELFGVYFNVVQGKSAEWGVRSLSFSLSIPFSLPPPIDLPTPHIPHHLPPKTPPLIPPPRSPRLPHRRTHPLPIMAHHGVCRNDEHVGAYYLYRSVVECCGC